MSNYLWTNISWNSDYDGQWQYSGGGQDSSQFKNLQECFLDVFGLQLSFVDSNYTSFDAFINEDGYPTIGMNSSTGCKLKLSSVEPNTLHTIKMMRFGSDNIKLQQRDADTNGNIILTGTGGTQQGGYVYYYFGEIGIGQKELYAYRFNNQISESFWTTDANDDVDASVGWSGFDGEELSITNTKVNEQVIRGFHILNKEFYQPPSDNINSWYGFMDTDQKQKGRYWNFANKIRSYDNFDDPYFRVKLKYTNGQLTVSLDDGVETVFDHVLGVAVVWIDSLNDDIVPSCPYPTHYDPITLEDAKKYPGGWMIKFLQNNKEVIRYELVYPTGRKYYISDRFYNINLGTYSYNPPKFFKKDLSTNWEIDSDDFNNTYDWKGNWEVFPENDHYYSTIVNSTPLEDRTLTIEMPSAYDDWSESITEGWSTDPTTSWWAQNSVLSKLGDYFLTIGFQMQISLKNVPKDAHDYYNDPYTESGKLQLIDSTTPIWGYHPNDRNGTPAQLVKSGPVVWPIWDHLIRTTGKTHTPEIYGQPSGETKQLYLGAYMDNGANDNIWQGGYFAGTYKHQIQSKGFYKIIVWG